MLSNTTENLSELQALLDALAASTDVLVSRTKALHTANERANIEDEENETRDK